MAASPSPPSSSGSPIECRAEGTGIIITIIRGKPGLQDSRAALRTFSTLIGRMERPVWISDATELQGYESAALTEGRNWFSAFKQRGGRHVILVSEWSIAMMAARAMGFGFGVRIQNKGTMVQALVEARLLRASDKSPLA